MRQGRILRLGTNQRVRENLPNAGREIDLAGRAVVPAFSANLERLVWEALARSTLDLSQQHNIPEIFALVEQSARTKEKGEWILGFGWNKHQWGWQRFPHRADLDLVAPHHPVALFSADNRVAWLNSRGLSEIGIAHGTPNPSGGEIERDPTTRSATGILKEAAVGLLDGKLPEPTREELRLNLAAIFEDYLSMGVGALETYETFPHFEMLREMGEEGLIPIPVVAHVRHKDRERLAERGWKTGHRFGNLEVGGLWLQVDGTLISQTALLLEPYGDDWNKHGIEVTSPEGLAEAVEWCARHGFAPIFQASGDAACLNALEALAECAKELPSPPGAFLAQGDLLQWGAAKSGLEKGVTVVTNPRRILSEREVGKLFWGSRWKKALNLRAWREHGVRIAFGSDEPLRSWSPFQALAGAVSQSTGPDSRLGLSLDEALLALCRSASHAPRDELDEVFLAPSLPAHFVVLSGDPFRMEVGELGSLAVDFLFRDGAVAYERTQ
ncbi:MAG: amidohydrolase family protein [Candidatus Omnitrophica bacterium]|nr:amidohydrolase family protein [Candidatus Omnitrophota bacterium]